MELERSEDKIPSIFQTAIYAAENILKRIGDTPWNQRLMLKSDDFLKEEKYRNALLGKIEFFTAAENICDTVEKLESVFLMESKQKEADHTEMDEYKQDGMEMEVLFRGEMEEGKPVKIFLEVRSEPYRIPLELVLIPFPEHEIFPQTKTGVNSQTQETFSYHLFPSQEYLSIALYEIIKDLELIRDLSWYEGVYDVIVKEPVEGRKVWECLNRLIKEYPIPSFEKRLDTLKGYENYGYMKKRWKEQNKHKKEAYPRWEEVIALLGTFLTPIFEGVRKDEVFFGDWMPELGRYLD